MSQYFKVVTPPTEDQILAMLNMQDELNQRINKDWINQSWDFGIAVADECMEALGHLGWKWWKDSSQYQVGLNAANLRQFKLELVDLWHFALSMGLEEAHFDNKERWSVAVEAAEYFTGCKEDMEKTLQSGLELETAPETWIKRISSTAMSEEVEFAGSFELSSYYMLLCLSGMDGTELYETYLAKYTLNKFRYANGYAEGTYLKNWLIPTVSAMYQEDNWFLEKLVDELHAKGEPVSTDRLYAGLLTFYKQVHGGK